MIICGMTKVATGKVMTQPILFNVQPTVYNIL